MENLIYKSAQGEIDPDNSNLTRKDLKLVEEHKKYLQKLTDDVKRLTPCYNQLDVRTEQIGQDRIQVTFSPSRYILISKQDWESTQQNMTYLNDNISMIYKSFAHEAKPAATRENISGESSNSGTRMPHHATKQPRQSVSVQLYSLREDIVSPFEKSLQTKFEEHGIDLHFNKREDPSSFSHHELGLVLCLTSSRLGTNVKSAMSGIQESNKTGLVVLHHRDEHDLPTQPSARLLPEYRFLGDIFDMVYLQDRGLYECPFNTKAMDCIVGFITKRA